MKPRKSKRSPATEGTQDTHVKNGKEVQSGGVIKETDGTNGFPPLATSVGSLQEAVEIAVGLGLGENCLFNLARALLAFGATTKFKLSAQDREQAFQLWWRKAQPLLPSPADPDEYRFIFYDAVKDAKTPLGANPLHDAISRADSREMPVEAARYETSARLRRLVAVCYHLQIFQGNADIFLGLRDAAQILGEKSLGMAGKLLDGLVHDGILTPGKKGTPGGPWASRFRFNFAKPIPQPGGPKS